MMDVAPEYIVARRVLLDALAALEAHLPSLVLVGAQAVYLHTGDADLSVPLFTTDADLATAKAIKIGERLEQAGAQPSRLKAKDALDAFRILQAVDAEDLAAGFRSHGVDVHAAAATAEAIDIYRTHAAASDGQIARLAAAAAAGDPTVSPSFAALVQELLHEL